MLGMPGSSSSSLCPDKPGRREWKPSEKNHGESKNTYSKQVKLERGMLKFLKTTERKEDNGGQRPNQGLSLGRLSINKQRYISPQE